MSVLNYLNKEYLHDDTNIQLHPVNYDAKKISSNDESKMELIISYNINSIFPYKYLASLVSIDGGGLCFGI